MMMLFKTEPEIHKGSSRLLQAEFKMIKESI